MEALNDKLVIFDLDGTILDTLQDLADSLNHTLAAFGYPQRTLAEVRSFVGNGIRNLIRLGAPEGLPEEEIDRLYAAYVLWYDAHKADQTGPYEGIPELLQELKSRGIRMAVVSNKSDPAVKPLCEQYFPGMFDAAVGERPGVSRKPAPDAVLAVLQELETEASDAVYIGDSEVDILTARNAGLPCISVDWGFRDRVVLEKSGASRIVSNASELLMEILT